MSASPTPQRSRCARAPPMRSFCLARRGRERVVHHQRRAMGSGISWDWSRALTVAPIAAAFLPNAYAVLRPTKQPYAARVRQLRERSTGAIATCAPTLFQHLPAPSRPRIRPAVSMADGIERPTALEQLGLADCVPSTRLFRLPLRGEQKMSAIITIHPTTQSRRPLSAYRRMRDEAPLYHKEDGFCVLSRVRGGMRRWTSRPTAPRRPTPEEQRRGFPPVGWSPAPRSATGQQGLHPPPHPGDGRVSASSGECLAPFAVAGSWSHQRLTASCP